MNAYLLELLTCLFRLCFNQCNASLHFRSSKHSSYFQKPILPLLVAMGLWSHVLSPLWLLSRLSFVVSAVASSSTSPIYDHISCTARVVFHSLRVLHLTTNWPSCFHSLCIRVCIRFQLRLSEVYQQFFHSPASVHSSRWPFLKGVHSNGCVWSCIWPFILLFLLAFNCVEHQLLRKLRRVSHNFKGCLIYETSQPQKPKWFTSSMGEMFHRSNWLLMWSYHILTGNGKQERVSRDFSVPTVAHVRGFGCFEFASVWMFYLGSVCFLVLVVFYCWFWYLCFLSLYIYIYLVRLYVSDLLASSKL